ncbi:hypothetical protein O3P69_002344 [Scylla paramamosain]|uniref:Protein kinase domain-containing protein n=1 Tax=Scylla paramamosain TaxID=85552 RepID=A0AAW0V5W8_SCYPA
MTPSKSNKHSEAMERQALGKARKHKMTSSSRHDECPSVTKKRRLDSHQAGNKTNPKRADGNRKRLAAGIPEAESSPTPAKRLRIPSPSRHGEFSLLQRDEINIDTKTSDCKRKRQAAGMAVSESSPHAKRQKIPSSRDKESSSMTKKLRSSASHPGSQESDAMPNSKRKRQAAKSSPFSAKRQKTHNDEETPNSPFLSAEMYLKYPAADGESQTVTQEDGKEQTSCSPKVQQQSDEKKEHTKPDSSKKRLSTEEAQAQQRLHQHGVPLLTRRDVEDMSSAGHQSLGSGTYGSCYKVVDPNTLKPLVVKTFSEDGLQELVTEAINLHELRLPGVQDLVGVCVHSRQIVTHFGGTTADQFFETKPSFADTVSVFLQISRILQKMLERGFAHNDIKGNNVCIQVDNDVPKATVIDLGLARKVGTLEIYEEMPDTRRLPWLAPELLRYTHPCGEASDVYSLAHLLRKKLPLKKKRGKSCSLAALEDWTWRGQRLDPTKRPSLAALIELLETLYKEASKGTKE